MALFWERMLPAYAAFDDGDFTGATLDAAIAVEMLIDATLALALWDSGIPADIAYKKKDRGSIVGRVRTRLALALGDDSALWDTEGACAASRDSSAAAWPPAEPNGQLIATGHNLLKLHSALTG
jgi:hypothetical protein